VGEKKKKEKIVVSRFYRRGKSTPPSAEMIGARIGSGENSFILIFLFIFSFLRTEIENKEKKKGKTKKKIVLNGKGKEKGAQVFFKKERKFSFYGK
jgi:hypothetical protein